MALDDKREQLSKEIKDVKIDQPEKREPPPQPAAQPDKSVFGGKDAMSREAFKWQLRDQGRFYQNTKDLDLGKREALAEQLFGKNSTIKQKDVKMVEQEIAKGKWGKYKKDFSDQEKRTIQGFLKGIQGQ